MLWRSRRITDVANSMLGLRWRIGGAGYQASDSQRRLPGRTVRLKSETLERRR
jgi:hypothetical protein